MELQQDAAGAARVRSTANGQTTFSIRNRLEINITLSRLNRLDRFSQIEAPATA